MKQAANKPAMKNRLHLTTRDISPPILEASLLLFPIEDFEDAQIGNEVLPMRRREAEYHMTKALSTVK
jgi:hypothetical protein